MPFIVGNPSFLVQETASGSYVVHLAGGLVIVVTEAGHRGHVVVVFALGTGLVCGVLVRVLLYVFWPGVNNGGKTRVASTTDL